LALSARIIPVLKFTMFHDELTEIMIRVLCIIALVDLVDCEIDHGLFS